jgi:hypothetical protein
MGMCICTKAIRALASRGSLLRMDEGAEIARGWVALAFVHNHSLDNRDVEIVVTWESRVRRLRYRVEREGNRLGIYTEKARLYLPVC